MTSNPRIPPIVPGGDDLNEEGTREVDGDEVLDPEANDDLVDSADADRLAAEGDR